MKSKLLTFGLALAFVVASVGMVFAEDAPAAPAKKYGINVGEYIKAVTLKGADGSFAVKTDSLAGNTLLVMVSSVCTACRTELQELTANEKDYFAGKIDIYPVIIDMDPAPAVERIKGFAPTFKLLADSDYTLGRAVNIASAPSAILLDKEGKILYKGTGYNPGTWKEYVRILKQ